MSSSVKLVYFQTERFYERYPSSFKDTWIIGRRTRVCFQGRQDVGIAELLIGFSAAPYQAGPCWQMELSCTFIRLQATTGSSKIILFSDTCIIVFH